MPFTQGAHGLRRDDLHVLDVFCLNFPQVVENAGSHYFRLRGSKNLPVSTQEPAVPVAVVLVQGIL